MTALSKKTFLIVFLFLAGFLAFPSVSAYDSPTSEELYFTFNDSCPPEDLSGNDISGTCEGDIVTGIPGVFDSAYEFDGDGDYVNLGEPTALTSGNLGDSMALSAW